MDPLKLLRLARRPESSFTMTANNGVTPTVTITHRGDATTYRVDGRIVSLADGTTNPHPAPFRCEMQVGGVTAVWDALLSDGEWADIILGSLEPLFPETPGDVPNPPPTWMATAQCLVIRRGKQGQHVHVPDTGAVVELTVHTIPPPRTGRPPKRFHVVRDGDSINVIEF